MRGAVFEASSPVHLEVVTGTLTMHKDLPLEHELRLRLGHGRLEDKIVIVVDDVLNSAER